MNDYKDYCISFKPLSPVISVLQSDTLFGHIAWTVRYIYSEKKLIDFLNKFKDRSNAPFLITDGFPQGSLPKPFFKSVPFTKLCQIISQYAKTNEKEYKEKEHLTKVIKTLKKQRYLKKQTFIDKLTTISAGNLLEASLGELDWDTILNKKKKGQITTESVVVYHNTVNRVANQVLEGFYQQTTRFYAEEYTYEVYVKTNSFDLNEMQQIFRFIQECGFGRDKSTGKGRFETNVQPTVNLPVFKDANAFMTLSHFVPDSDMPRLAFYRLMTKYGRLGGHFASSKMNPFKKPIMMMKPGSIFLGKPNLNYGLLMGGENRIPNQHIHSYAPIRHYACAFPLGLRVKQEEFEL